MKKQIKQWLEKHYDGVVFHKKDNYDIVQVYCSDTNKLFLVEQESFYEVALDHLGNIVKGKQVPPALLCPSAKEFYVRAYGYDAYQQKLNERPWENKPSMKDVVNDILGQNKVNIISKDENNERVYYVIEGPRTGKHRKLFVDDDSVFVQTDINFFERISHEHIMRL